MNTAMPLAGVRILDLSRVLAGPWCTMNLADLGAEVLNIEHPAGGNESRKYAPFTPDGQSAYYFAANRNKKSITIDIATKDGQTIIRDLARMCDVFVENFRLGGLNKYGLDYHSIKELNPRIVYCSISGFGRHSPMAARPGYDLVVQAEGGFMSVNGEPDGVPIKAGIPIGDLACGLNASQAILAALFRRERTGEGTWIDIALFDSLVALLSNAGADFLISNKRPERFGNNHPSIVPYGAFPAKDAWFVLSVGNDGLFEKLCEIIERLDLASDKRFATNRGRVENRADLVPILNGVFSSKPTNHWLTKFEKQGIPAGRIRYIDEVLSSEEVLVRGMVQEVQHASSGKIRVMGSPLKFPELEPAATLPPPVLGEHTETILRTYLKLSERDIARLKESGAIGNRDEFYETTNAWD